MTYYFLMFRQSSFEEWVLPSLNVWPHSLLKYTIFQVGLTIQLAIFLSKYNLIRKINPTYNFFLIYILSHHKSSSWIDDPITNIHLKVQIQRYRCLKLDILGFMFRQSAYKEWVLPSHYVGAHAVKNIYKIPSWTDGPFSNIPIKVQIQRHRSLKLDICEFMFWQSTLEEWVLPCLNVWPHGLRKYSIFQVWLAI